MSAHFDPLSSNSFYIFIIAIVKPCVESDNWVFCESASIGYFFSLLIIYLLIFS